MCCGHKLAHSLFVELAIAADNLQHLLLAGHGSCGSVTPHTTSGREEGELEYAAQVRLSTRLLMYGNTGQVLRTAETYDVDSAVFLL